MWTETADSCATAMPPRALAIGRVDRHRHSVCRPRRARLEFSWFIAINSRSLFRNTSRSRPVCLELSESRRSTATYPAVGIMRKRAPAASARAYRA